MTASTIELYSFWRSAASFRVRIALSLKGLPWIEHPVDLLAGEQLAPGFSDMSPQGAVPVLVDGDLTLTQSMAIIEYLDERYPLPPLLPAGAGARAEARAFALIAIADGHPLQVPRVRRLLASHFAAGEDAIAQWCGYWQRRALQAMETRLARRTSNTAFCFGENPGFADIALVPQVFTAEALGIPVDEFPSVATVFRRCMQIDAFSKNSPLALHPASAGRN